MMEAEVVAESVIRPIVQRIAAKGAPLFDRLTTSQWDFSPIGERGGSVARRIERWAQRVGRGDRHRFEKRLSMLGLSLDAAQRLMMGDNPSRADPLPQWALLLEEVLLLTACNCGVATPSTTGEQQDAIRQPPLPFREALSPFIAVARRRFMANAGDTYDQLTRSAPEALEEDLWRCLAYCAAPTLFLEFSLLRSPHDEFYFSFLEANPDEDPPRELYRTFVTELLRGGWIALLQEYPVLARLLSIMSLHWAEANSELLGRLAADRSKLCLAFSPTTDLGRVIGIQPSLSDCHHQGRTVSIVEFESGIQVVYKPRDIGIEDACFKLFALLNQRGASPDLRPLRVLNCDGYGWVEHVANRSCHHQKEVQRYFQRAGMLVCLMYALDATDCHRENLIASGEHPVLIDLETLLHRRRIDHAKDALIVPGLCDQGEEALWNSPLRSDLLPIWQMSADGKAIYDISGLGGTGGWGETGLLKREWREVNTDAMKVAIVKALVYEASNTVYLGDHPVSVWEYRREILTGFESLYRLLMNCRHELTAPDGAIAELARQQIRFVARSSRVYAALLTKLLEPQFLRNGLDRSIELDALSRLCLDAPELAPLLEAELKAMEQMDIPHFSTYGDACSLWISTERALDGFFERSGFSHVAERLNSFCETDLAIQLRIIEASLDITRGSAQLSIGKSYCTGECDHRVLSKGELMAEALRIAEDLRAQAISYPNRSATWVGPMIEGRRQRYAFSPLRFDMYAGSCGVALFLGGLHAVTGSHLDLARSALQPVQLALHQYQPHSRMWDSYGIGGVAGIGSMVYTLCRMARFLGDESLLRIALHASRLITPARIANDKRYDIVHGAAGSILALLVLHQESDDVGALHLAKLCGEHLLAAVEVDDEGYSGWRTSEPRFLTGLSHGAAGIALALWRLGYTIGDERYVRTAQLAMEFERSLFDSKEANWPDLRNRQGNAPKGVFKNAWCHGATGIGIARLQCLSIMNDQEIRGEVQQAIKATSRAALSDVDHLCCGNFGRVEFIHSAGVALEDQELRLTALQWASHLVHIAHNAGGYCLHPPLKRGVFVPGFFQGICGIGYTLLRLAYQKTFPSILGLD